MLSSCSSVSSMLFSSMFMNEHASNLFHVQCRIPYAKDELLAYIDDFIRDSTEAELRGYREAVTRAFR